MEEDCNKSHIYLAISHILFKFANKKEAYMSNVVLNKEEILKSFRAAKKHKKEREEELRKEWQGIEKIALKEKLA